jgi:hypothetical protein
MPPLRASMTLVLLGLSVAGCSSSRSDGGTSASCALVIEVNGITYIAGRGGTLITNTDTDAVLPGKTLPCDDGGSPVASEPVTARSIRGVRTADALASSSQLMLAGRLWKVPRAQLPLEVQPYVRP